MWRVALLVMMQIVVAGVFAWELFVNDFLDTRGDAQAFAQLGVAFA